MSDQECEQTAFEWFAQAHPHEAFESDPQRFWTFFHEQYPYVSLEQMEALLKETNVEK